MHRAASEGYHVIIVAPLGRDAESAAELLRGEGYQPQVCADLSAASTLLGDDTGVILITEEALQAGAGDLASRLGQQEAWSDVPIILLAAPNRGGRPREVDRRRYLPAEIVNIVVLERPLGSAPLLSSIASAMRSRQKQFEMRDRIAELAAQTDRLARQNSELAEAGDALRDSERKLHAMTNSIDQMVWSTLPDGFHDFYNARWYEYTGVPEGSTDGEAWNGMFHPDDQDRAWSIWRRSLETGEPYHIEYRLRHRSGAYRWVLGRAQALRDDSGTIVRWFGTCTDIDDIVSAREVMGRSRSELETMVAERTQALEAQSAQRERAEAALRQSQKMEAVGQLTGGIAHDFNNMLTGVIGAMDIMKRRLAAGRTDDLPRFMDAASTSAQRAAALTARLLAFSRRQSLDAKPIDVNALLDSLHDLLQRSVRENISLRTIGAERLPLAVADANQLENAILNLVINARDAMPGGGQLTVETSDVTLDEAYTAARPDVKSGRYVMIAVSDTGVGIAPDVLERIFEPFFSTKPTGQGTGLGLSMVYGFARQSGGQVRVHSEVGTGTSVKLYLPVSGETIAADDAGDAAPVLEGRGQTVLLVEDDASVRLLVREVLEELGYATLEAEDADRALPIIRSSRQIDLLVSDVGLPGMNGRQLAEEARSHRPDLPVLFVTGYAENAAIRAGFLGTNMGMITKPFSIESLSAKIAEMTAKNTPTD